jgi:hypothetical protein
MQDGISCVAAGDDVGCVWLLCLHRAAGEQHDDLAPEDASFAEGGEGSRNARRFHGKMRYDWSGKPISNQKVLI